MRWERDGSMIIDAETKQDVADVFGVGEELDRRLRLIVAAPTLYEALREIKDRQSEPSFILPKKMIDRALALVESEAA